MADVTWFLEEWHPAGESTTGEGYWREVPGSHTRSRDDADRTFEAVRSQGRNVRLMATAPAAPPDVGDEARAAVLAEIRALLASASSVARAAGEAGMTRRGMSAWSLMDGLGRLAWLLGLSPRERAFVAEALADAGDPLARDDVLGVFADWLDDQGRVGDAARLRRLLPQDGDVLTLTLPAGARAVPEELERLARRVRDHYAARGRKVLMVALPAGHALDVTADQAMRDAGWMRLKEHNASVAGLWAEIAQLRAENARLKAPGPRRVRRQGRAT